MNTILSLIVLLHLNTINLGFDGQQLVREFGARLCPYTNFCTVEASKQNSNNSYVPCCRPCFCDDNCWKLDNCCPDKEPKILAPSNVLPCKNTKVKGQIGMNDRQKFRVVDTCPPSEENETLLELCTGLVRTGVKDYIWVSDYAKGNIYQNLHCAKCHKIDKYVFWQTKTTCKEVLQADFVNAESTLMSDSCDIINVVPASHELMSAKYECFGIVSVFLTCSMVPPILFGVPREDIMSACEQSFWVYRHHSIIYKNAFCYICNYGMDTTELCSVKKAKINTGFSVLVNFNDDKNDVTKADTNTDSGCERNEVKDKYMGRCHKLICPFGRASLFGRCQQILSNFEYSCFEVSFYLETVWKQTNLNSSFNDMSFSHALGEKLYRQFEEAVNWAKVHCQVVYSFIGTTNDTTPSTNLLLFFRLLASPSCTTDAIFQHTYGVVGKTITLDFEGGDFLEILVNYDRWPRNDFPWKQRIYQFNGPTNIPNCFVSIRLGKEMFCPHIELQISYVGFFSAVQVKEKLQFLTIFENVDSTARRDTIRICLEEYFAIMSQADASLLSHTDNTKIIVAFILYLLL